MFTRAATLIAGLLLALAAPAASAAVLAITSDGGENCSYGAGSGLSGACITQTITPHSAWQPNNPAIAGYGGVWISYADTGFGGGTLAPRNGSATNPDGRQMIFAATETFSGAGSLDLWVWADDTVNVFLDGVLRVAANFTDATCAQGPVGCEPGEYFHLSTELGPGTHQLVIEVFQFGSGTTTIENPFGLLYSGQFMSDVVEPGMIAIFAGMLITLFLLRRPARLALLPKRRRR